MGCDLAAISAASGRYGEKFRPAGNGRGCVKTQNPKNFRGVQTIPNAEKIDCGAIAKA